MTPPVVGSVDGVLVIICGVDAIFSIARNVVACDSGVAGRTEVYAKVVV